MNITISIPQEMAQFYSKFDLARMMKLNFIIEQYAQGNITTKMASDWANLSEVEFLKQCSLKSVPRQTYESPQELEQEFAILSQQFLKTV